MQPAWQGVMYSTRVLESQTGLKSSEGQEQDSMQPGNSSRPGWALVGEKAGMVGLVLPPSGQGYLAPAISPESHGQISALHRVFYHQSCSMTRSGEPLAKETARGLQWEKWEAGYGPEGLRPLPAPRSYKSLSCFCDHLCSSVTLFLGDI